MNLAQSRDVVRRRLGQVPPIDTTLAGAKPGDAPSWDPSPSNAAINQCISEACSMITTECGVVDNANVIEVPIDAQTDNGPYLVPLNTLTGQPTDQVVTVKNAWWADTSEGGDRPLVPQSFEGRERVNWRDWSREPGLPAWYAVDNYRVYLMPAPANGGTLKLRVGLGLIAPMDDISEFHGVPADYVPRIIDVAVFLLASINPADTDMGARLPAMKLKRDEAIYSIRQWYNTQNAAYQPRLIPRIWRA